MGKALGVLGIIVVVVPLVFFGGVFALDATVSEQREPQTITNETFTPDGGNLSAFDDSRLDFADYNDTVTVRNKSTGAVFQNGGNYSYFDSNGTLKTTVNSDLANASTATVTYSYVGLERGQTAIATLTTGIMPYLVELIIIFGAILTLAGLVLLGGAA